MIQFRDFVPAIEKGSFLSPNKLESFESTLSRANDWVKRNKAYEILNIETVVLPNIHGKWEEGSTDPELSFQEYKQVWYQFIRIWYR